MRNLVIPPNQKVADAVEIGSLYLRGNQTASLYKLPSWNSTTTHSKQTKREAERRLEQLLDKLWR